MRSRSLNRLLSLALAIVFCISAYAAAVPASAKTVVYNEPNVRVGMYVTTSLLDTRHFSSLNQSANGFELGYLQGESFQKLFSLSEKAIIIVPQVNSRFENGKCVADENGNIGAYSAVIGKFSSYSSALSAAKSKNGFVAVVNGGFEARAYSSNSAEAAKKASGGRSIASPSASNIFILSSDGKIIASIENGKPLALRAQNGGAVNLPMRHRSGSINYYDYSGIFEYSVRDGRLWMENIIGLEDYTKCVMANEIGTNYSVETRKAFAVLARTVPLYAKHSKQGFDVCTNSACCQVYHGLYRMSAENNQIVDATRGLFCAYKGAPIMVLYHNSNGGASCSSVAAWGGTEVPYLTTVFQEEYEDGDKWQRVYTKQEFYNYLTSRNSFSKLSDDEISMKILETDPYGSSYITILSVSDGSGNVVEIETSEDVRSACGFSSANFDVEFSAKTKVLTSNGNVEERNVTSVLTANGIEEFDGFGESYKTVMGSSVTPDTVTVNGSGVGHGVGFSATGSEKLSKDGYSYKYILEFFFNGTTLEYAH